jgi:hypothetical protein
LDGFGMALLMSESTQVSEPGVIGVVVPDSLASRSFPGSVVAHSLADLLDKQPDLKGLYLCGWNKEQCALIIDGWRVSKFWYKPAFVDDLAVKPHTADGAIEFAKVAAACDRLGQLALSLQLDPQRLQFDERLLYYLYLREPYDLTPVRDRNSKHLYGYPEAEALAPESEDPSTWIASLTRRELLQPAKLIDRTRHCRTCSSAHLHYIDVCPQCRGIEIHASESVHCFACGNVAPGARQGSCRLIYAASG